MWNRRAAALVVVAAVALAACDRGGTEEGVDRLTSAEYTARAAEICKAATGRMWAAVPQPVPVSNLGPGMTLEEVGALSETAVRFSQEALVELRTLVPPETDRAGINEFYSLLEQQTEVLRQVAVMAAAGDAARALMLWEEHRRLAAQADALGYGPWCPVALAGLTYKGWKRVRAEYSAQATAICSKGRFLPAASEIAFPTGERAIIKNPARIVDKVLAKLRALPAPEADRAQLDELYSVLEQEIDVLRQVAAADAAGDRERSEKLSLERIDLTHRRDALVLEYGLYACALPLPA